MFAEIIICALMALPSVEFVQSRTFESSTIDQYGNSFTVTGLSGLVWAGDNTWYGVMDNSSHIVSLEIDYQMNGYISVELQSGLLLSRYGDYEDIALGTDGSIILSDETTQDLHAFHPETGDLIESYALHPIYQTRRSNLGCESFCSNGESVWIANEEALLGDGPTATPENGTTVRITHGPLGVLQSATQVAYEVDQMPGPYIPITNDGQSGLVAILELPSGEVLCLERSLAFVDALLKSKIYLIDFSSATDVQSFATLLGSEYDPCNKELLYEGPRENMEGLSIGPELDEDSYLLLGIVDDGDPISDNRINAFIVHDVSVCSEDVNNDDVVGVADILELIEFWGSCNDCDADINDDGVVDVLDILQVVAAWGPC
ncbi:MAG: esterase-like activity of phytase family protein [Planctomycetes bacterium]|nr:esterase-like activity of phytase family protein [Planctomycetota bacterium]MBL6998162.1 esterase-like activity of phytase family protein [Phycisphaerales bacterium]